MPVHSPLSSIQERSSLSGWRMPSRPTGRHEPRDSRGASGTIAVSQTHLIEMVVGHECFQTWSFLCPLHAATIRRVLDMVGQMPEQAASPGPQSMFRRGLDVLEATDVSNHETAIAGIGLGSGTNFSEGFDEPFHGGATVGTIPITTRPWQHREAECAAGHRQETAGRWSDGVFRRSRPIFVRGEDFGP